MWGGKEIERGREEILDGCVEEREREGRNHGGQREREMGKTNLKIFKFHNMRESFTRTT